MVRGMEADKTSKTIKSRETKRGLVKLMSGPVQPSGVAHAKNVTHVTYELRFLCSVYIRKTKEISFPMTLGLC